jgi:serine protease Do
MAADALPRSTRCGALTGLMILAIVVLPAGTSAIAEAADGPPGFANIVAKVKPAVISVRVRISEAAGGADASSQQGSPLDRLFRPFGGQGNQGGSTNDLVINQGSGFFISSDGYAVTNKHVIENADKVRIKTDDGKTYTAKVVGIDTRTDIALIKVDGRNDFPFAGFAKDSSRIGDWVLAVGNPFGLGGTVTAGIISARGRDIGEGPYDDFIQIDAPVNMGNSGGPTFNMEGSVIGVNTAIYSPSGGSVGIAFAIPAETVRDIVTQLKEKGRVTRGYMGVQVQDVTPEIAEALSLEKAGGALVAESEADKPAVKAGIEPGDVIITINGTAIEDSRAVTRTVSVLAPGTSVKVTVVRGGEERSFNVTLAALPDERQANAGPQQPRGSTDIKGLGLTVAPEAGGGIAITGVDPAGIAAERGLKIGDVIVEVTGKKVGNPSDLTSAIQAAQKGGKRSVLLRLKSGNGMKYVALPARAG